MELKVRRSLSRFPDSGAILIVSLWALVILSIISVSVSSLISPQIKLAKTLEERSASVAAAESVLKLAFFSRLKDPSPDYDSLQELATVQEIVLGKAIAASKLTDEESKININTASKEIIMRLPGLNDEGLADNIIAYRNRQPLALKEELLLAEGVRAENFEACRDLITTCTEGKVNINTAPEGILWILGFSDNLIELLLRYRKGDDGIEATADDNIFKDINTVISDLHRFSSLTVGQVAQLQNTLSQDLLTVKSKQYAMEAQIRFLSQPPRNFKITFDTENNRILRWQEP
jgi:type II secretory pathway component PulK